MTLSQIEQLAGKGSLASGAFNIRAVLRFEILPEFYRRISDVTWRRRVHTISVVADTRVYDMPRDFEMMISAGVNDGELKYIGEEWTRGNYPRSFSFDPSGRFLYCCNQRSDNVAVFQVDAKTGGLRFTGHYAAVGNPSIVAFVELAKGK